MWPFRGSASERSSEDAEGDEWAAAAEKYKRRVRNVLKNKYSVENPNLRFECHIGKGSGVEVSIVPLDEQTRVAYLKAEKDGKLNPMYVEFLQDLKRLR